MIRLPFSRLQPYVCYSMRLYLGVIFLWACFHKILDPKTFALDIATYDILPLALVNPMALCLPYLEALSGLMLVVGIRIRAAALAVMGMMAMFLVSVLIALARGLDTSCGCFASQAASTDPIGWLTVARDLAWLGLATYVFIFDREPLGLARWFRKPTSTDKEEIPT